MSERGHRRRRRLHGRRQAAALLHRLLCAFIPCCLLAIAPVLLQCGGSVEPGTDTGHSPLILRQKLYLELSPEGLRVLGAAGALAPAGAAVRVTNVRTGASAEASAAVDGSLDVPIEASPSDELEVTVTSGGRSLSERISFTEIARRPELDGASCGALEATLHQSLNELFEGGDRACADDADCTLTGWGAGTLCYQGCGELAMSVSGAAEASWLAEEMTAPACRGLQSCEREPPPTCGGGSVYSLAVCREGRCEGFDPVAASCEERIGVANARYASLRANADKTCSMDTDCALAQMSAGCIIDCVGLISVAASAVQALEGAIQREVEQPFCQIVDPGCSFPMADCSVPDGLPRAICDAGACALRFDP
jgi:hypothetical protein